MFDAYLRRHIDPPLDRLAALADGTSISANRITVGGFVLGACSLPLIASGRYGAALLAILLNRLADGLDGAVARRRGLTDLGGYLDIVLDFLFYASVPFAFALADPARNALPAAYLLFAFAGPIVTFLAFAILAAKHGLHTEVRGRKTFYYLGGLTEGAETALCFVLFCLFPNHFAYLAYGYGTLCWITTGTRIAAAVATFRIPKGESVAAPGIPPTT